jgi:hypothetical protein
MIGQSEAANSSLEDITIVTKAQYNETAAVQPRHQPAAPVIFEQPSQIEGRE